MATQHSELAEALTAVWHSGPDRAIAALATGAMLYPIWQQVVSATSTVASVLAPVLGLIVLSMTIYAKKLEITERRLRIHQIENGDSVDD